MTDRLNFDKCPTREETDISEPNTIRITFSVKEYNTKVEKAVSNLSPFSILGTSELLSNGAPVGEGNLSVTIQNHSTLNREFTSFWNELRVLQESTP